MSGKKRLLQVPQGTEGFYLEEALRHKMLVRRLEDLFLTWGYLPAETPVFDFYDTYKTYIPSDRLDSIYRLMDREGDLLLLRNDVTLFLCKQMGLALTGEDLPVRVFYGDTILRHQNVEDISKNEFFQMGAELIGIPGTDGDMEIITLAVEVLEDLNLDWRLHIGHSGVAAPLASLLTGEGPKEFHDAVILRDFQRVKQLLTACGLKNDEAEGYIELLSFIGTVEEFESFVSDRLHKKERYIPSIITELQGLADLFRQAERCIDTSRLRIDFSELGSQAYHTGIVFQGYTPGIDSAFLSGGRYDNLLKEFGFDAPSAGFSFLLRKVEGLLEIPERPGETKAEGTSFAERLTYARKERKKGRTIIL